MDAKGVDVNETKDGPRFGARVLNRFIDAGSWPEIIGQIKEWRGQSRVVCICNVHSLVTAMQDISHRHSLDSADMATPDGMPIAWTLRWLGFRGQQRINGPDLMWKYCRQAAECGEKVFFYGSTDQTLELLELKLKGAFPNLQVVGKWSPPFRSLTEAEDMEEVSRINASGASVVFVSLGCPKQELWMQRHRGKIHSVMIGVGAAFDYHAGTISRAPLWMQNSGLEWLHRLASEPRRLWKRYFFTNAIFIAATAWHFVEKAWRTRVS